MRRLVLETSVDEVGNYLGVNSSIEKLESFELVSLLKEGPNEWAMICRVKMKDPKSRFEDVLADDTATIQVLEIEKAGSSTYFLKRRVNPVGNGLFATGGFLSIPLEISGGRMRASFLGSSSQLKRLLKMIDKEGIGYKITSNTDARFSPASPLGLLTEKQRRAITTAFNLGYYEIPKRVSSEELASKLRIREATFVRHRAKAEKRLLAALLSET